MDFLVIGGTGLVGSNVVTATTDEHTVQWTSRNSKSEGHELDKTERDRTTELISKLNPDVVVDTAAFHAVDDCEHSRAKAYDVNGTGTRNVAIAADDVDAHLIYFSTDYVFAGLPEETPYKESDYVAPINYYAETKYVGEQAAKIAAKHTILRPSVIYGLSSDNFVTWALGELDAGNEITIVNDQISAPTYAPDLAQACLDIAEQEITGLYHATGPESCSRYEFTVRLAEVYDYDTDLVKPITTEEFGQEAPRPSDSTLDSTALYEQLTEEFTPPKQAFSEMAPQISSD
ncbi:dTDP-4-dehydrorhamnose reductase [Halonotius aquaticus]|uniref:dTDP-4-dehydrorhamnose reductase n=1 Tax=Halonotius aquaticus TaxID=2216978 RepID=A0A3A6QEP8_9EURY|nr:dTDP-4-dehydrorhamnose reductase [Halonotius aquaticus]RJX44615.1 dTDP-4-dehydrorhamnose reductase [Halonotius aquaticus]